MNPTTLVLIGAALVLLGVLVRRVVNALTGST
jgi:hypothetical protein